MDSAAAIGQGQSHSSIHSHVLQRPLRQVHSAVSA